MTETLNQTFTDTLVRETCCNCHISFGMTKAMREARLEDLKTFYCPNGHAQHYTGKPTSERLRQRLEWAEARERALRDQKDATERSYRALKGVVTRTKRRIAAGVCPCCNRTFQDLHRHMSGQHPAYVESATA